MPHDRSESVETITLTLEEAEQMLTAQESIRDTMNEELTESQLIDILRGVSVIVGFAFKAPTPVALANAVFTFFDRIAIPEREIVLNSIDNGIEGIEKIIDRLEEKDGGSVTAVVGFLNFNNLGFRTVSSAQPDILD